MKSSSLMYSIPDDEFIKIVKESKSYKSFYKKIGYKNSSTSTRQLFEKRCSELGLTYDFNHMSSTRKRTFEDVFCENSDADRETVKRWYKKGNYSKYECAICKIGPEWNGQELVLRSDHINGVNNDNRLENLRWVCPNCDSQLPTFCGRNSQNKHKTKNYCIDCGKELNDYHSKRCKSCVRLKSRKVERPSREELKELIRKQSFLSIGKKYNVSDNAIRKWCKSYNLPSKKSDIKLISEEDWGKL